MHNYKSVDTLRNDFYLYPQTLLITRKAKLSDSRAKLNRSPTLYHFIEAIVERSPLSRSEQLRDLNDYRARLSDQRGPFTSFPIRNRYQRRKGVRAIYYSIFEIDWTGEKRNYAISGRICERRSIPRATDDTIHPADYRDPSRFTGFVRGSVVGPAESMCLRDTLSTDMKRYSRIVFRVIEMALESSRYASIWTRDSFEWCLYLACSSGVICWRFSRWHVPFLSATMLARHRSRIWIATDSKVSHLSTHLRLVGSELRLSGQELKLRNFISILDRVIR